MRRQFRALGRQLGLGLLARANRGADAIQLVVEDVAEALGEDEGENVILAFRRVLGAADGAGGIPDPGFEGFGVLLFHSFCSRTSGLTLRYPLV